MTTLAASAPAKPLVDDIVPDAGFEVSNELLRQPDLLRKRLNDTGYLFFKKVLNVEKLLDLRRDVLELCREHGWLDPIAPLMDARYAGIPFPNYSHEYMPMYRKLIKLESFNAFSHSPEILSVMETVLGAPVLTHRRNIARVSFPRNYEFTTQPHQDFHYIRGTPETYTTWIPIGDCPQELGGVAVLEGSHKLGFLPHEKTIGAGGHGVPTEKLGLRWVASGYEAGDLLMFHSYTIHGALSNHTEDRLRLSLDFRYQRQGDAIDPSSMQAHYG